MKFKKFFTANKLFFILAWQKCKSYYFIYLISILYSVFNNMLLVYIPKFAITEFVENKKFSNGVLYICFWILTSSIWAYLERKFSNLQTLNVTKIRSSLQKKIYIKLIDSNMLLFEDEKSFNDLTKALNYTDTGADAVVDLFSQFLTSLFTLIGVSYVIGEINVYVLIFLFFTVIFSHFFMKKCNKIWFEYQQNERLPKVRFINYISNLFSDKNFIFEIKLNNAFSFAEKLLLQNRINLTKEEIKNDNLKFRWNYLSILLSNFQLLICYIYFGYLLFKQMISFATYSSLFAALQQFSTNLSSILNLSIDIENKSEEAGFYIDFLIDSSYSDIGQRELHNFSNFRMLNVDFFYPGSEKEAISNMSIEIKKGEKIALVGENGSGKTTFLKLLMGLYPQSNGQIFVNEINMEEIKKSSWLERIAVVSQESLLLPIPIAQNISLSDDMNNQRIKRAIDFVDMNYIYSLTKKEQSVFSKRFNKDGVDFSGGEKQKIAIARALYKSAEILLLDEPSSSLDPNAEYDLFKKIYKIGKEKTVVFISHRLSTTVKADKIFVFKDGKIIEVGNHEELLKKRGHYFDLFNKQAEHYKL